MSAPNTLDEIRQKIIKASFSPDYWGEDYSVLSKDQQEFVDKIQALIREARIDELERLIGSSAAGDKYRTKAKHGFVTIEERLEQLKEQSNE